MKSILVGLLSMLAFSAGAVELVLVEGSVPEDATIGLAGVEYKVLYDGATGLVIFHGRGSNTASNCEVIFHAINVRDDADKGVIGYNGYCGHTPGPDDILMSDLGEGWLGFSTNAAVFSQNLGMFLTVVLRQDDARNLERFFGIQSMMTPNDWAGFDGSWTNRIKIVLPRMDLDAQEPRETGLVDVADSAEVNPGVLLEDNRTRLIVQNPGTNLGNYTLTWADPANNKQLKLRAVVGGSPTGGWLSSPVTSACSDPWPKTYVVKTTGPWALTDRVDVVLSHSVISCTDTVRLVRLRVDLDAMKVSHNAANGEIPDSDETNPGAFVPINNDDDDYDASNTADKDQSGAINGESDLLPIKLHKVEPAIDGSKYTLDIPSHVKIWQNADRSGTVSGTTEFDANADTTLYVEGFTVGSGNIKINWKNGSTTLNDCDEVKVTVFNWIGPLNVPGYAIYRYTASGALGTSKWITPSSGTIKTGTDTSDVTILWDGGPVVGKAVYQANGDYVWDLEVNVVQAKIKTGGSNQIVYDGPPEQSTTYSEQIRAAPSEKWAMLAHLTVEKIVGPTVGGNMRGVRFIEMGFIQTCTMTRNCADFDQLSPPKKRVSGFEGTNALDCANSSTPPWVDSMGVSGNSEIDGFLAPGSDEEISDHPFDYSDRPLITGCDTESWLLGLTVGGVTDRVDRFEIEFDLRSYFAVRTTSAANSANFVYTQRTQAEWEFDGSGDISGIDWSQTGSGNTGPSSFTEVTDGSCVPITTGTPFNNLPPPTWSTEDQ